MSDRPVLHWLIRGETGCGVALTTRQFESRTTRIAADVTCPQCRERIAREQAAAKHGGGK